MSIEVPDDKRSEMDQLVADSSRPSKFDSVTMNLATELLIAQFASDPMQKVRHTIEGFLTLAQEQQRQISDEQEIDLLTRRLTVCLCLMELHDLPVVPHSYYRKQSIPWSFSALDAEYYLDFYSIQFAPDNWSEDVIKGLKGNEDWARRNVLEWLVTVTRNGCDSTWAMSVKTQFEKEMIPRVATLATKIRKAFVDGSVWEKMLFAYRGKKDAGSPAGD